MNSDAILVNSSILLRLGKKDHIQQCYDEGSLTFGCAANWINLAINRKDYSTGDLEECIFARIKKDDPRSHKVKDSYGNPMGSNLIITDCETKNIRLLRFAPTILMPVLCLYNVDVIKLAEKHEFKNKIYGIDLDLYCDMMQYDAKDASFIIIHQPSLLYDDLRKAISQEIETNNNLIRNRFYKPEKGNDVLVAKAVDYHQHTDIEYFFDYQPQRKEIFWKMPRYESQSELRIVIPRINFRTPETENISNTVSDNELLAFNLNKKTYNYKNKELKIYLPHFKEYAEIAPATEIHTLLFWNVDRGKKTFCMSKSKMTYPELLRSKIFYQNFEDSGLLLISPKTFNNKI